MIRLKLWLMVFVLVITSYNLGFCLGINSEQPISTGEMIYYDVKVTPMRGIMLAEEVEYTYLGFENNSLKIKVKKTSTVTSEEEEVNQLNLSLNDKKQALLKVKSPNREIELLITVVDEFYRIKVEEFKTQPPLPQSETRPKGAMD